MNDKKQLAAMGEHLAEQQPMCMAKRIEELGEQERVMAGLLRETLTYVGGPKWQSLIDDRKAHLFLGRVDAALSGKLLALTVLPVVPEGWQLVPVEPSESMVSEAIDAGRFDEDDAVYFWSAMLAAAPKPEAK